MGPLTCVGDVQMRDPAKGRVYIVAEARMEAIPGAVPKQKKGKKGGDSEQKGFEVGHACRSRMTTASEAGHMF